MFVNLFKRAGKWNDLLHCDIMSQSFEALRKLAGGIPKVHMAPYKYKNASEELAKTRKPAE